MVNVCFVSEVVVILKGFRGLQMKGPGVTSRTKATDLSTDWQLHEFAYCSVIFSFNTAEGSFKSLLNVSLSAWRGKALIY